MTVEEALAIIDLNLGNLNGTRADHAQLTLALEIVRNAITSSDDDA